MKRIIKWLKTHLSRREILVVTDPLNSSESVNDDELDLPKGMQDLVSDAPQPDSVDFDLYVTVPDFKPDDQPSSEADETTGFDPYDPVEIHKK